MRSRVEGRASDFALEVWSWWLIKGTKWHQLEGPALGASVEIINLRD